MKYALRGMGCLNMFIFGACMAHGLYFLATINLIVGVNALYQGSRL